MREIHKKTYASMFKEVIDGNKAFDLRLADFNCQTGDILVLDEIDEKTKEPTGRSIRKKVGYILKTKELDLFTNEAIEAFGFQIMSLQDEGNA